MENLIKTLAIIQARMSSSRFPGKVLADIHGKPLIQRVIDRVCAAYGLDEVVVATTTSREDDVLAAWLENHKIIYYRGSENNVLDRFYQCAKKYSAELIIRVTSDDPLKDPRIISQAVSLCNNNPEFDYVSNTLVPTYPEGLDIEVFRFRALERAHLEASIPSEREHVTPFIWKNPNIFVLYGFEMKPNLSHWRWTVDKPEDLEFVRQIFGHFIDNPLVGYNEVIDYINEHPELMAINDGIIRSEGYLKSIANERK